MSPTPTEIFSSSRKPSMSQATISGSNRNSPRTESSMFRNTRRVCHSGKRTRSSSPATHSIYQTLRFANKLPWMTYLKNKLPWWINSWELWFAQTKNPKLDQVSWIQTGSTDTHENQSYLIDVHRKIKTAISKPNRKLYLTIAVNISPYR